MASDRSHSQTSTESGSTSVPWFRNQAAPHPFVLQRVIPSHSNDQDSSRLGAVAIFPWTIHSLEKLWGGQLYDPNDLSPWSSMVEDWIGAIAIGCSTGFQIESHQSQKGQEVQCVDWVLRKSAPYDPLVVFTASKLVYILDPKSLQVVGCLHGHGRLITSIAVHPTFPDLFCTTSRDLTTRIYQLDLKPKEAPNNPHWPPSTIPSLAGPAHGLDMRGPEGNGIGRCVAVLVGGRSGGHQADVLAAAFHPEKDLIATCGMDRAVKIWRIPWFEEHTLVRADKPLFTSAFIHNSRVLSVAWIAHDLLVSHCAPALQVEKNDPENIVWEPGTVVMWRWLGYDRYFPVGEAPTAAVGRCISDFQESSSFIVHAAMELPVIKPPPPRTPPPIPPHISHSPHVHFYCTDSHDPLLITSNPSRNTVGMINVKDLPHPDPPVFPEDSRVLSELTQQLRLDENDDEDDDENETPIVSSRATVPGYTEPWVMKADGLKDERIEASAMGVDGQLIVGVGSEGSIWVWLATG